MMIPFNGNMGGVGDAVFAYQEEIKALGGCSNGSCIINPPTGLHTNATCICYRDQIKMQQYIAITKKFIQNISSIKIGESDLLDEILSAKFFLHEDVHSDDDPVPLILGFTSSDIKNGRKLYFHRESQN